MHVCVHVHVCLGGACVCSVCTRMCVFVHVCGAMFMRDKIMYIWFSCMYVYNTVFYPAEHYRADQPGSCRREKRADGSY